MSLAHARTSLERTRTFVAKTFIPAVHLAPVILIQDETAFARSLLMC